MRAWRHSVCLASAAEAISLGAIPSWLQEERALLFILPPDKLLALYGCCNVFLSLHRSEGFSCGMAEALQLGLDVIATTYGSSTISAPVRSRTPCTGVRLPFPVAPIPAPMATAGRNPIWSMQLSFVVRWRPSVWL